MTKCIGITGDLMCENQKEIKWKIKDFFQLSDKTDLYFKSTEFSFSGASWNLRVYPNGYTEDASIGWIGFFLAPTSLPAPVTVDYSLSIETSDGKSVLVETGTHMFDKKSIGYAYGWPKFILRSKLIERKSELLPSDFLTVICTVKNSKINGVAGNACFDKSAQTDEATGVWKLQKHFKEILLNGNVSDVILKVGDQEFKSHKCVLAARSPVFLAMVKHEMKEKITHVVDIQDCDPKTFSDFLFYLYTGSGEIVSSENAVKLYIVADKYQVDELKDNCLDHMLMNISVDIFCDVFTLSLQHNEKDLKEACIKFFSENSLTIVKTCQWQTFLCENPILGNELFIKHLELIKQ